MMGYELTATMSFVSTLSRNRNRPVLAEGFGNYKIDDSDPGHRLENKA